MDRFQRSCAGSRPRKNVVHLMQNLSPRHVMTEESLRLGVESGWYLIKISGTFVSGRRTGHQDHGGDTPKVGE